MYISLWENSGGHPDNISFMQFSTKIDGFEQKDSQGFENSYNSYEQYPLEKFFILTIYQNYTLALNGLCKSAETFTVGFVKLLLLTQSTLLFGETSPLNMKSIFCYAICSKYVCIIHKFVMFFFFFLLCFAAMMYICTRIGGEMSV